MFSLIRAVLAVLAFACSVAHAAHWAVIVAGSKGYNNYRHQADAAHAYQIVKRNGIPESNIILFMYDDVVNTLRNPYKGKLYNQVGGPDVYDGIKIDYKGYDVRPEIFLQVLKGESVNAGSGKVLNSTKKDNVFIYFVDHGAVGILGFPYEYLYVNELNDAIQDMWKRGAYKSLLFYVEACEAGSMFNEYLPNNINVLAVTSTDPRHSSWASNWSEDMEIPLADEFSFAWMQDTERNEKDRESETVKVQYDHVKVLTKKSHVCYYGNKDIFNDHINIFQFGPKKRFTRQRSMVLQGNRVADAATGDQASHDKIAMKYVEVETLRRRYLRSPTEETERLYKAAVEHNKQEDNKFEQIQKFLAIGVLGNKEKANDICHPIGVQNTIGCVRTALEAYESRFGRVSDYTLSKVAMLHDFCEVRSTEAVVESIMKLNSIRN